MTGIKQYPPEEWDTEIQTFLRKLEKLNEDSSYSVRYSGLRIMRIDSTHLNLFTLVSKAKQLKVVEFASSRMRLGLNQAIFDSLTINSLRVRKRLGRDEIKHLFSHFDER